jgi:hypothetical protein
MKNRNICGVSTNITLKDSAEVNIQYYEQISFPVFQTIFITRMNITFKSWFVMSFTSSCESSFGSKKKTIQIFSFHPSFLPSAKYECNNVKRP